MKSTNSSKKRKGVTSQRNVTSFRDGEFLHVNPRCFITIDLLFKRLSAGLVQHAEKNYWIQSSYGDKGSLCVKWDLGLNVSGTHLWDRGAAEWPLNSKTALFIWSLIDGAVIYIHSLPHQRNKSLHGPYHGPYPFFFFSFSFPQPLMQHP